MNWIGRVVAFVILAAVGIAVAFAMVWLTTPTHGVTVENAAKIRNGMTLAEVEAVFGGPPGDYRTVIWPFGRPFAGLDQRAVKVWLSDDVVVNTVFTHRHGKLTVTGVTFLPTQRLLPRVFP